MSDRRARPARRQAAATKKAATTKAATKKAAIKRVARKTTKKAATKKAATKKAATKKVARKTVARKKAVPAKTSTTTRPAAGRNRDPEATRVPVGGLRTLGGVAERAGRAPSTRQSRSPGSRQALAVLEQEFDNALALKEKIAAESAIGAKEKGRQAAASDASLRSIVASLEGMNRFALKMGLITPAESRAMFAAAMERGLYEGWR